MEGLEQSVLHEWEALCTQEQPPACMSQCPLHVDGRSFCGAVAAGDYDAAITIYENVVPFPRILSRTCAQHCQKGCKRATLGGAIWMRGLEEVACENGTKKKKRRFLPRRNDSVAVIGGGISGLTAALELGKKGCKVTVFEKTDQIGGQLLKIQIPEEILVREWERLQEYPIQIKYGEEVLNPENLLKTYGAVYTAWGGGNPQLACDEFFRVDRKAGVFAGGTGICREEYDVAYSMADGKRAAISIDRHLKRVSMDAGREKEEVFETTLFVDTSEIREEIPKAETPFSKEEAQIEAQRCLDCKCLKCVEACMFLQEYKTFPRKYVREVYNNLSIAMGNRHANRMINSCSLCGQCGAICPFGLDVAAFTKEARQLMVRQKKMPISSFEFALRDMEYSNSDEFFLIRHQPEMEQSQYLFFPGCQMGASTPELVIKVYEDLMEQLDGGVGLYLGCCQISADWAGERELFQKGIENMKTLWKKMGEPEIICACPTCYKVWKEEIPEASLSGVWTFLETKIEKKERKDSPSIVIKDACGARGMQEIRTKVRMIVEAMGYEVLPQKYEGETGGCCGFGGLMPVANRLLAEKMANVQVQDKEQVYLTYCMNCRDRYTTAGAKAMHLLELVYEPEKIQEHVPPTWSKRQDHRKLLKQRMLASIWREVQEEGNVMKLYYGEEMKELLEERMILEEDIRKVIAAGEEEDQKILDTTRGCFIAGKQIGNVHFWVYYREKEEGYEIMNAYSHRMNFR